MFDNWVMESKTGKLYPIDFDTEGRAFNVSYESFGPDDWEEIKATAKVIWEVEDIATMADPKIIFSREFGP